MMGSKAIYNIMFLNVLCTPFIKHLMINVRKMLQMNLIMSE